MPVSTSELQSTILRYWLALLRQEEALTTRPKARRLEYPSLPTSASIASPASGQDYVKLAFAEATDFLVDGKGPLTVSVAGECAAFFENWLAAQYRRYNEDGGMEHLVFFPALLTPRQELAGLLRFPVHIDWTDDKRTRFRPPTAVERAKKQYPEPPTRLEVLATSDASEATAFFVDTRVLQEVLRIDQDRLETWLADFSSEPRRPRDVLRRVCRLLSEQLTADEAQGTALEDPFANDQTPSAAGLLAALTQLLKQRLTQLRSGTKAYDVAVLLDASRNRATFHVQRDLQEALNLIEESPDRALPKASPLAAYLGTKRVAGHRELLLGRFNGQPLTESQRAAGELFLGSKICAVQGPPGTGKTHLILSLAAEQLLKNTLTLCEAKHPAHEILVVTSTNNRAVDNVIDPLSRHFSGLPLALRVGSREIMDRLTAVELEKIARWLERRRDPTDDEWRAATQRLRELHAAVREVCEPAVRQRRSEETREQAKRELATLEAQDAEATNQPLRVPPFVPDAERAAENAQELRGHLGAVVIRFRALSALAEADKRTPVLALEQHFNLSTTRHLNPITELLGAPLPLRLPPQVNKTDAAAERRTAWEEATEEAIAVVSHLDDWLSELLTRKAAKRRLDELRHLTELSATTSDETASETASSKTAANESVANEADAIDWSALEPQLHELFQATCDVRELWAARNKKPLLDSLQRAVAACKAQKSLRSLLTASKGPGVWLQRLFPVWGCTLLSLGNNFPPELESLSKVVIDEAGQCHSAYAVSAMVRAQAVLVIGDTNQLEPVVELSAADEARLLKSVKARHLEDLKPYRVFEGSYTSAQSVADRVVLSRPVLIDHFRCQVEIAEVCEQLCNYGLVTRTPRRSCSQQVAELDHPLLLTPVAGEQQRLLGSWGNEAEVQLVVGWVQHLLRSGLSPADIGVITPFRGQLDLLWRQLRGARVPLEKPLLSDDDEQLSLLSHATSGVALGTVHRFQGGERRVILFTTTVSDRGSLRFLDHRVNLVNVAASRAKEHLITVGHSPTLSAGTNTRLLVKNARSRSPLLV